MKSSEEVTARKECHDSLLRIQNFDPHSLAREDELGRELNFTEIIPAATRLIGLYRQISITVLDDLPWAPPGQSSQIASVKNQANSDFNIFDQILKFSQRQNTAFDTRNKLIQQVNNAYPTTFNNLHPIISYSTSKSADFKGLETEARAMLQTINDKANDLTAKLQQDKKTSEQILLEIRKVAAEKGVSQQAEYFNAEANHHEGEAKMWRGWIIKLACALGIYAILTLWLHKIPSIEPEDLYQTVQLAISKVLIFGVLSYVLYLATKNYLAHKHNAVINKHRQNALMTYKALVDAAKDVANKEVILTHASSCIFAPQETGYSGAQSPEGPAAKSVVELLMNKVSGES